MKKRSLFTLVVAGPDKGKGGKFLVLPPGYKGDVPKGYFVVPSKTNGVWLFMRGSQDKGIKKNADGSIDIYFAPKAPKGMKNNWIQTIPGKSWFIILRMYGPLEPWLNKTWHPSELELVK